MLLSNRLPRILLSVIYIIIITAGANFNRNISGSIAVCSIHVAFRLIPDHCAIGKNPRVKYRFEEDVYDSIALVFALTGCIYAVYHLRLGDRSVPVCLAIALITTVAFAIGQSKKIKHTCREADVQDAFELNEDSTDDA